MFDDIGFVATKKGIEVSSLRQKAIANNVANVTTPNYKAIKVKFEEILKEKVDFKITGTLTHPKHIYIGKPKIEDIEPIVYSPIKPVPPNSINNVDIDEEMIELAKNSINWNVLTQFLSYKYRLMLSSIRAGVVG